MISIFWKGNHYRQNYRNTSLCVKNQKMTKAKYNKYMIVKSYLQKENFNSYNIKRILPKMNYKNKVKSLKQL